MVGTLVLAVAENGEEATHNPILPATNEIIWGALSFVLLFWLLSKFAYPAVKKGMDARSERIRADLDRAEEAKGEAERVLGEYRAQLAEAKTEAARIIDEARQAADQMRQDLRRQAEAEVAEVKARAQDDIAAQANRAMADLQARVTLLAIELAEKVVGENLDRDRNNALVERFIREMGSSTS